MIIEELHLPNQQKNQGNIESCHRTMKNKITLEHYYLPWELEKEIKYFMEFRSLIQRDVQKL
jgi:hypothetical protein